MFIMPPEVSHLFVIFSHQSDREQIFALIIYTINSISLSIYQILLSNSFYSASKRAPLVE